MQSHTAMNENFTDEAWSDYQYWIKNDKKQLKRNKFIDKRYR
jgi:Txe/YoeB family toxin of Txe-Axe toxin-antitoxin module